MWKAAAVCLAIGLGGCAAASDPAPNSTAAHFDPRAGTVQVMTSDVQPVSGAALVASDGSRYPAAAINLLRGPYVAYNPPPTLGIGIGGFGFSGCCSGFGTGVGVGFPVGHPSVAATSDQYVSAATIPTPADYARNWPGYHLEVQAGARTLTAPAPAPG